jgi:hypothetical protein
MQLRKNSLIILILFLFVGSFTQAQKVKMLRPYDGSTDSYLMVQIKADTIATGGLLPDRVYQLENGGLYLNTEILNVASNRTIRLMAPEGAKPIIYQYPTGTGANPTRPPGNLFVLLGGKLEMTNIAVAGYFEPEPSYVADVQGGLINTTQVGSSIIIDNCILTNINGQHIRTGSATKKIKVTNSIFANMGSLSSSNFGAGKGLDLREASCDSLILVNNTFVNYQDRIIRHYNFANPLAGTGIIGYAKVDHNTFVNGMGFHGLLSLGNVGKKVIITNNLFVDAFAAGSDTTDLVRSVEWGNTGELDGNGNNKMPWIFSAPNDTTAWTISKNYFSVSTESQNFFTAHPPAKIGNQLSDHIKARLGSGAATAFTKIDVTLKKVPALMTKLMEYYWTLAGKTKDKPGYDYKIHDMDRQPYFYYEQTMDASYPTTNIAYTGADNSLPAGDLNWFPDKKHIWLTSVEKVSEAIVTDYALEQNYPNPFNPSTIISYSIPKAASISLVIYNSLGQEVNRLISNTEQSAGKYEALWNGKDSHGNLVPSGVYFYQLLSNDFQITKKMMLIK